MQTLKRFLILFLLLTLSACLPTATLPDGKIIEASEGFGFVQFEDYQTYFETAGEGQPLLMIHGIGGGSSLFQYRLNLAPLAAAGFESYAIDLLGFGKSSRPAIRYTQELHIAQIINFIERVIEEPTIIMANGLSAAYSIRIAAERPDLVEKLILIGPTGLTRLNRPQDERRVTDFDNLDGILGTLLYGAITDEGGQRFFLLDAYINENSLTPEVVNSYDLNLKVENAPYVIYSFITGNLDQDVRNFWPDLPQDTLIIWGGQATTTPLEDLSVFLEQRAQTSSIVLDGAKLLPNEDRASAFNRAVLDFLE